MVDPWVIDRSTLVAVQLAGSIAEIPAPGEPPVDGLRRVAAAGWHPTGASFGAVHGGH